MRLWEQALLESESDSNEDIDRDEEDLEAQTTLKLLGAPASVKSLVKIDLAFM